jgi:hypothetical protein
MDQNRSSPNPLPPKTDRRGEGGEKRRAGGAGEGERVGARVRRGEAARGESRPRGARTEAPRDPGGVEAAEGLRAIESSAQEGLMAIGQALEEQLRERPYVTLGVAFGVGLVVSQALSSRLGRVALLAAGAYAATKVFQSDGLGVLERVLGGDEGDDVSDEIDDADEHDDEDLVLGET